MGLFAGEDIKKGEVVWQYDPKVDLTIPKIAVPYLPKDIKQLLRHFSFSYRKQYYVYSRDNARYANHSNNPNVADVDSDTSIAVRNIKKGEEIFENYRKFKRS